ncbi:efflux RND transporter permease subunit [Aneurinibacillus sp. Ricciae_BoGa-3]|uniref:efflux RND transporter permease subunit n=1 Tax=Aneurinibacillus sp. Ricciae_BoGa-3 TaxID=3022697 RepID=UPI0023402ED8|nr:efflux RND transporter permease subunit [Aneurinibacillus sp. Ricciae_BoGa-3]WCK54720.1 efflux RND transporter permease subunit [Aneurinibacillus sp. Ricciae_BoGa-3]
MLLRHTRGYFFWYPNVYLLFTLVLQFFIILTNDIGEINREGCAIPGLRIGPGSIMQLFIEAVMKRSVLIIVSILLILGWGGMSAYQMERDYLPPINNSALMVSVQADHYQADQVKTSIAGTVNQAIRNIKGLQSVESNSFNGGLLCSLYFPYNYDMEKAEGELTQALSSLALPSGVHRPLVTRLSTSSFPIMRVSLIGDGGQAAENTLRTSTQNDVVNELKSVPGVGDIRVSGAGSNGFVMTVRMKDLEKAGLTLNDVQRSLTSSNTVWPQGNIVSSSSVRVTGWGVSEQDVKQTVIHGANGKAIPLSAVADVSPSMVDLQTISRTDAKPSVILDILKNPSSNIMDVSDHVHQRIQQLQGSLPQGIHLAIALDRGADVQSSLNGLIREGLLGCVFSMLSVFLFLRNVRATLLIALSLPICLLTTTAVLKGMGITLNILTLSGLVVAMGRVVDDSIVILDNIYRRIQESDRKINLHDLAGAVREMMPAIVSSTATTIAVFLPISLVGGIIQSSFSAFAWTVVIALVVSLLVSILAVPAMARVGWREFQVHSATVEPMVKRLLLWAFPRRKWIFALSLVIFAGTIIEAASFPVNVLPTSGPGGITIKVALPEGSSLSAVDTEVKRVEDLLKSNPQIDTFSSALGSSFIPQFDDVFDAGGGWIQSPTEANVAIKVKPSVNVDALIADLQHQLTAHSSQAVYTVTNQNISGDDSQLKVVLTGADARTLDNTARMIQSKLQLVPGLSVAGAENDKETSVSYHLSLNKDEIQRTGIKVDDILNRIQPYLSQGTKLDGLVDGQHVPFTLNTDVDAVAKRTGKDAFALLANETFQTKGGKTISLQKLVSPAPGNELSVYRDRDGQPFALVTANIISPDVAKVTQQVQDVLQGISLPKGVNYSFGGISQQVQQMIMGIAIALSISVVLVLLIVAAVFRGWKAPLSVLSCIPLSIIGSVWGMALFGEVWNLAALIGILMLVGIVVTNGIVLVDKIERNMAGGMVPEEAILQGTLSRVRPVLMTALTTVLTLLPVALSSRTDTVVSQTLGIVVVGGMISSTFISLLLIPVLYKWMYKKSSASSSEPVPVSGRKRDIKALS